MRSQHADAPKRFLPAAIRRACRLVLLLALVVPCAMSHAAAKQPAKGAAPKKTLPEISFDYSVAQNGDHELLIQSSAPIKGHKSFSLTNPARLVLDIPNATLRGKLFALPVDGPELIRIRVAPHPDKVRFVFDLTDAGGIIHNILPLENGLRVTIASGQDRPAPAPQAKIAPVAAQETQASQEPKQDDAPPPAPVQTAMAAAPELAPTPEPTPAPEPLPDPISAPVPAPENPSQTLNKGEIDALFGTQRVSVVFHKSPARDFFRYVAEKSGRQIEMQQELTETVSLRLADVPLGALVTAAADATGFALKKEGNRIIAVHVEDAVLAAPPVPAVFLDSPPLPAKKSAQKKGRAR